MTSIIRFTGPVDGNQVAATALGGTVVTAGSILGNKVANPSSNPPNGQGNGRKR